MTIAKPLQLQPVAPDSFSEVPDHPKCRKCRHFKVIQGLQGASRPEATDSVRQVGPFFLSIFQFAGTPCFKAAAGYLQTIGTVRMRSYAVDPPVDTPCTSPHTASRRSPRRWHGSPSPRPRPSVPGTVGGPLGRWDGMDDQWMGSCPLRIRRRFRCSDHTIKKR